MVTPLRFFFGILLILNYFPVTAGAEKLNFLFILVDDLGYYDIGIEGSSFYETPNIDALARSGMRFTNGYAACRVCSPSRASIMLGKYPTRHGITNYIGAMSSNEKRFNDPVSHSDYVRELPSEDTTLAEALQSSGYSTFFAGKWHLGDEGSWPEDHGFQINRGGWSVGSPKGGFFSPWVNPRLESGPDGQSLPLRLAEETSSFIKSRKDSGTPFFAFLSFYHVHGPIQTTEQLCKKYRDKAKQKRSRGDGKRFFYDGRLPVRKIQDNPVYAGMMETLDDAVGLVLDELDKSGLRDNTVVIFTSDNGGVSAGDAYSTSLLPMRGGKGRHWEGGIRVPLYISAPKISKPGSTTEVPVIGTDFYPTILELAGLPVRPEQHVDGVSLVPILQDNTIKSRDLFWHYPHYGNQGGEPSSVIRSGNWKLIFHHEDQRMELYALDKDIEELTDVSEKHPEIVEQLGSRLDAWLEETKAVLPQTNPQFDAEKFEARLRKSRTTWMQKLENKHARYLDDDWAPDPQWWGSLVPID